MSNSTDRTIARRTFLRGAASIVGATALGIPGKALASSLNVAMPLAPTPLAVMYWDGASLVSADTLPFGDMSLSSVKLTIHGYGAMEELRRLDVHPTVRTSLGTRDVAFYAWTAPPSGTNVTRCVMPVDLKTGLRLSTHIVVDGNEQDVSTAFLIAGASGAKLREGCYVLCAANPSWETYELVSGPDGMRLVSRADQTPAPFQHIVITVARA